MSTIFKQVASCAIGNVLEFYDFIIYGIFATVIAKTFFSNLAPAQALLHTFLVLTIGYFTRPIGGILFGYIGDRVNARLALSISMIAMALATTAIGLLPGYAQIGVMAPVLLVIFRLLQGLAVSGESANAMVFLYEQAPPRWLALTTIMSLAAAVVGVFLALGVAYVVSAYSWRLSFILSFFLGALGLYLRLNMSASEKLFVTTQQSINLRQSGVAVLLAVAMLVFPAVYTAFTTVFLVPFLVSQHLFAFQQALQVNLLVMLTMFISLLLGALLADLTQAYRRTMIVGFIICAIATLPLFFLLLKGHAHTWAALLMFTALGGISMGPEVVVLVGLFLPALRCRGVGLSHGLAFSCITGLCPSLFSFLLLHSSVYAIAYVLIASALISACVLLLRLPQAREAFTMPQRITS